jgi:hypothetical protein
MNRFLLWLCAASLALTALSALRGSYELLHVRPQAARAGAIVVVELRTPPGVCILAQTIEYGDGQASPMTADDCMDDMRREHRYMQTGRMTVRGRQRDARGRIWTRVAWVVIS